MLCSETSSSTRKCWSPLFHFTLKILIKFKNWNALSAYLFFNLHVETRDSPSCNYISLLLALVSSPLLGRGGGGGSLPLRLLSLLLRNHSELLTLFSSLAATASCHTLLWLFPGRMLCTWAAPSCRRTHGSTGRWSSRRRAARRRCCDTSRSTPTRWRRTCGRPTSAPSPSSRRTSVRFGAFTVASQDDTTPCSDTWLLDNMFSWAYWRVADRSSFFNAK